MIALIGTALLALPPARLPAQPLGDWSRPLASKWETPALEFRHRISRWAEDDGNPLRPQTSYFIATSYLSTAALMTISSAPSAPTNLTISCGNGSITISFKDGTVKFDNCDPDEGARQFWFKVTQAYPYFRSSVLAEANR